MSLFERLLFLALGLLVVAALVLLMRHDIGRNVKYAPTSSAAGAGRFWWQ